MEKIRFEKLNVLDYGTNGDATILPFDIFGKTTKVYLISNGHFAGCALAESTDGVVLCDGPYDFCYKGTEGIVIPEFQSLHDAEGLPVKLADTTIGKNIVKKFIEAYIATIESNPEVLKDVDMVQFSKYYPVLPDGVFSINNGAMSVKTVAYNALEHIIDQKTKGVEPVVKDAYKGKYRLYLAKLILHGAEKPDGEPEDQ